MKPMRLGIVYDFDESGEREAVERYNSSIFGFINACLLFSEDMEVSVINNRTILYNSSINTGFESLNGVTIYPVTPGDINYAILFNFDEILVTTMHSGSFVFLNLIKCMNGAKEFGIPIHTYSSKENVELRLISQATGGRHVIDSFHGLLRILSSSKIEPFEFSPVLCHCCNKQIQIGHCCSTCLAVYCKFTPICKRCKTKFLFARNK